MSCANRTPQSRFRCTCNRAAEAEQTASLRNYKGRCIPHSPATREADARNLSLYSAVTHTAFKLGRVRQPPASKAIPSSRSASILPPPPLPIRSNALARRDRCAATETRPPRKGKRSPGGRARSHERPGVPLRPWQAPRREGKTRPARPGSEYVSRAFSTPGLSRRTAVLNPRRDHMSAVSRLPCEEKT